MLGVLFGPVRAARQPAPSAPGLSSTRGVATPVSALPVQPRGPAPAAPVVEATLAAAGDLSCEPGSTTTLLACRSQQVSDLIVADSSTNWFLALGDLQYETGATTAFDAAYNVTYGRLKAKTIPAVGNHEYGTANAAGYFNYFGAAAHPQTNGWYSVELSESWHLVVVNSNCALIGGCDAASAQYAWLSADLAANSRPCVLAIWHHPLFTSSPRGSNIVMRPIWDLLAAANADVVLNGHDHNYERFDPQRGDTTADATAMRELIIGTGGRNTYPATITQPNSVVRSPGFGYLRLQLQRSAYAWSFVPEPGSTTFTDTGSAICH
jgi:hypothetical protein